MRLDVVDHANSNQDVKARESQALAMLGTCCNHRADFRVDGQLVPRLVIGIDTEGCIGDKLHQLAEQLHQDCITVFYPDQGCGELVGPGTATLGFQEGETWWLIFQKQLRQGWPNVLMYWMPMCFRRQRWCEEGLMGLLDMQSTKQNGRQSSLMLSTALLRPS
jgi:hypothetical protein